MTPLFAILGIDGGSLGLVINLLVLFLIVVYFALIYWTYLDAKRRIEDPVLIACATAASVFPFVGTVVYTILRPPEFREDREERELELRAAELRLRQLVEQSCPHCEYPTERNSVAAPTASAAFATPAASAESRWTRSGARARTARPRCAASAIPRPEGREGREGRRSRARRGPSASRGPGRRGSTRSDGPDRSERPSRSERSSRSDGERSGRSFNPSGSPRFAFIIQRAAPTAPAAASPVPPADRRWLTSAR